MSRWFRQLMRALQSAQADKTPLDPILSFLGTENETVGISVTLIGLDRGEQMVQNNLHNRYKDYFKDIQDYTVGGRPKKTYFAVMHSMDSEFVKLHDHEFLPPSVFMTFPQHVDGRIEHGCLLLSIMVCYI